MERLHIVEAGEGLDSRLAPCELLRAEVELRTVARAGSRGGERLLFEVIARRGGVQIPALAKPDLQVPPAGEPDRRRGLQRCAERLVVTAAGTCPGNQGGRKEVRRSSRPTEPPLGITSSRSWRAARSAVVPDESPGASSTARRRSRDGRELSSGPAIDATTQASARNDDLYGTASPRPCTPGIGHRREGVRSVAGSCRTRL